MGDIDYEALRFFLSLLQLVALAVIGVYTWVINRTKANKSAIDAVEDRVDDHDRRIDVIDARFEQVPTHGDIGKIYERLNNMAEKIENLNGQLGMISHQVQMVHEYLLNRSDGSSRR